MDLPNKIRGLLERRDRIDEHQVRAMMIMVRKVLELVGDEAGDQFTTVSLFCNWCAHTEITRSMAGLRTLASINDALIRFKDANTEELRRQLTVAVGFEVFRSQLINLLAMVGLEHHLTEEPVWQAIRAHLIEIIRDVPVAFPAIAALRDGQRKIYDRIATTPVKPGAGVIAMTISHVDYDAVGGKGVGQHLCLVVKTEDATTIVIPLAL